MIIKFASLLGSQDQGERERSIDAWNTAGPVAELIGSRVDFGFRSHIQIVSWIPDAFFVGYDTPHSTEQGLELLCGKEGAVGSEYRED